jgi:hypothetical protein
LSGCESSGHGSKDKQGQLRGWENWHPFWGVFVLSSTIAAGEKSVLWARGVGCEVLIQRTLKAKFAETAPGRFTLLIIA